MFLHNAKKEHRDIARGYLCQPEPWVLLKKKVFSLILRGAWELTTKQTCRARTKSLENMESSSLGFFLLFFFVCFAVMEIPTFNVNILYLFCLHILFNGAMIFFPNPFKSSIYVIYLVTNSYFWSIYESSSSLQSNQLHQYFSPSFCQRGFH